MRLQRPRREEPEVNLTSLIDVVFLLLIFFMISTTFNRETEIKIDLPKATGQKFEQAQHSVEISIDAKGRYYVNQTPVVNTQIETLMRAIKSAAGDAKDPQVILSADRMTPHQAVITAMDAARQLGFAHLTFTTTKPAKDN